MKLRSTIRGLPKGPVRVQGGWPAPIAEIVDILSVAAKDGSRAARPVKHYIEQAALRDKAFIAAIARGDVKNAAVALKRIARKIIAPGVLPRNKPSTAARKRGDARALRRVWVRHSGGRRHDRIYKDFTVVTNP